MNKWVNGPYLLFLHHLSEIPLRGGRRGNRVVEFIYSLTHLLIYLVVLVAISNVRSSSVLSVIRGERRNASSCAWAAVGSVMPAAKRNSGAKKGRCGAPSGILSASICSPSERRAMWAASPCQTKQE